MTFEGKTITPGRVERILILLRGLRSADDFDAYNTQTGGYLGEALEMTTEALENLAEQVSKSWVPPNAGISPVRRNHHWDYHGVPADTARHRECSVCGADGIRISKNGLWRTKLPGSRKVILGQIPMCPGNPSN
jgi:hypothetical protein